MGRTNRSIFQHAQWREQVEDNNPEFEVHILNDNGIAKAKHIAANFDSFLNAIKIALPAGRELSIVKTKLEEACFFAKKGMAKDPANQKVAGS
jgi:hypothetical protein